MRMQKKFKQQVLCLNSEKSELMVLSQFFFTPNTQQAHTGGRLAGPIDLFYLGQTVAEQCRPQVADVKRLGNVRRREFEGDFFSDKIVFIAADRRR